MFKNSISSKLQTSSKKQRNPCHKLLTLVTNALPAADYSIRPLYKYVKDLEECYNKEYEKSKVAQASTLYYLSQYMDRQKNKKK
jgi:hypothetical protein